MMNSNEYWRKREAEALRHYVHDEKEYQKRLAKIYQDMLDACQKEIESFYAKYAAAEGVTLAEAKRRVSKADIAALERKAEKYVHTHDFSQRANAELRLYNATMKINRLEMLKANIGLDLIAGHDEVEKFMGDILQGRTEEELKRQAGILGRTVRNNAQLADAIVNASFHNATFSDRIWAYQDMLRNELEKLLQSGLIQGKNPRQLARQLRETFDTTRSHAERLMRTELARVQTEAQKQSFQRNGFSKYEFIANGGCCSVCAGLNGKHFEVEKMEPGLNAPPVHPNCRCSIASWEDGEEYEAWLDYLDQGGTTAAWEQSGKAAWRKKSGKAIDNSDGWLMSPPVQIGDVSCTVTRGKHSFSDGTKGKRKLVASVTYTTPEGTNFVFPRRYDKNKQRMTPDKAIELWQRVPRSIRMQAQKTIEFVDYYNPMDAYWMKYYKNSTHSYATGGNRITFYRYEYPHNDDYVVRTYCHEAGHFIDTARATNTTRFSADSLWTNAMSDDKIISGKAAPTIYGENSPAEDFAESVAEYVKDPAAFAKEFPNRAKILSGIV